MKNAFLFSCLLLSAAATAAELYVSPKGNNKNPGTAQAPFATIARAVQAAKPGDTVKIAPGLYREQITFRKSGTKNAPITFPIFRPSPQWDRSNSCPCTKKNVSNTVSVPLSSSSLQMTSAPENVISMP
jgi:hypothetical protein